MTTLPSPRLNGGWTPPARRLNMTNQKFELQAGYSGLIHDDGPLNTARGPLTGSNTVPGRVDPSSSAIYDRRRRDLQKRGLMRRNELEEVATLRFEWYSSRLGDGVAQRLVPDDVMLTDLYCRAPRALGWLVQWRW